jgi:fructokinase
VKQKGMPRPTITSIGEVLVDFVSTATGSLSESPAFVKTVGGEAANVAVGLAKLGSHSVFIGKVGADSFGRYLASALKKHGVDVRRLVFDAKHNTRLAFVSLEASGERDFEFWEKIPAGEQLRLADINIASLKQSRIVNIAPFLLMKEPARTTALQVARALRGSKTAVAFDANVRLALWSSAAEARRVMLQMARLSTIVRMNEDEARFLTGKRDMHLAAHALRTLGPKLLAITLGAQGCYFQTATAEGFVAGFKVKPVDTTGCGDAFFAALLHGIAHSTSTLDDMSEGELNSICLYANAVGALTSLTRGGAEGVPYPGTIIRFLKANT